MFEWLRKQIEIKASIAQKMFLGSWETAFQDWRSYALEGYAGNPTIYSCINLLSDAFASVPLKVKIGDEYHYDHPLQKILDNPNPDEGGCEFRKSAASWLLLTGNIFTEKLKISNEKIELWNWQPYDMSLGFKKGVRMPVRYMYAIGQEYSKGWDIDPITGASDMMHCKLFNPNPEVGGLGQSPIQAMAGSADQMNAASTWRYNTLKNSASPSGILSTEQTIGETKRKELERNLKENHQGSRNAKDIMLLGGGLKWQQLSMSPHDMDWLQGTKMLAQEICACFSVPIQKLGIEGSQTYANYQEANIAFYTQGVLPLLDNYVSEINRFLKHDFEGATICYSTEDIEALEPLRVSKRAELLNTSVLTINEKRNLLGYERIEEDEADSIFVQPNDIPLGTDILDDDEKDISQAAKAFMKLEGIPFQEAYQKAFDLKQDADKSEF